MSVMDGLCVAWLTGFAVADFSRHSGPCGPQMCVIHFSLCSTTQTLVFSSAASLPVLMPEMPLVREEIPSFAGKSMEEGREVLGEDRKMTGFRD